MIVPETRYALARDGVWLAYQVTGEADIDLLWIDGLRGNLEVMWELPEYADFFQRLSRTFRVIRFDMRGTGLSDRGVPPPSLEAHMDDALAVLEAVGSQRTVVCGHNWGTGVASLLACTYPRRTRELILIAVSARNRWAPDYEWGFSDEEWETSLRLINTKWGTEAYAAYETAAAAVSRIDDHEYIRWAAKTHRHWVGPSGALALNQYYYDSDIRDVLRAIQVPCTVVAREWEQPEEDDYVVSLIPNARLARLPGADWIAWLGDQDAMVSCISGTREMGNDPERYDRVLSTVLFTDIVDSTKKTAEIGDRAWAELVGQHDAVVRALLSECRGVEVNTTGDGFFATFDGPARAVRCARSITDAVRPLGIEVRAGLHTGECETVDGGIGGIAVVIAARVAAMAGASQIYVSQTVRDLVAGSGLTFADLGEYELKGVPEAWRLYEALP